MRNNLVILINPSHDDEVEDRVAVSFGAKSRKVRRMDPPISIINLGGFIRDHGFEVVIVDTVMEENYKARIRELVKEKPLLIGISVILGKFTKNAVSISSFVKTIDPDIPVVWGGKLVALAGKLIFGLSCVDIIVHGDGEYPLLQLLKRLEKESDYRGIPGIGYVEEKEVRIHPNTFLPAHLDAYYISKDFGWDLIRQHINYRQVPYFINLYTSRGCNHRCAFCYLKDISGKETNRFRRRSTENIIREIRYLHETFGINVVTFGDDDFLCHFNEMLPVFEYLKRNRIFIEHFWSNIYHLLPDRIQLLKGLCQTVCYSIETVNSRLQQILNKKISKERIEDTNKQLRRAGINTVHNILFGIPTETDLEVKTDIDLLKELKAINPHVRANTYILSPIPKTPIFEFVEKLVRENIAWSMADLENFHFRYMGDAFRKFRPYLTPLENQFFEWVSDLANELFTELNSIPTSEQLALIDENSRLKLIFGDVSAISRPETQTRKYILDQVVDSMDRQLPMPEILPY